MTSIKIPYKDNHCAEYVLKDSEGLIKKISGEVVLRVDKYF